MKKIPASDVYCTTFCNHGHRVSNGHPVNHECWVLKPEAIRLERDGRVQEAIETGVRTERILNPRRVEVI